MKRDSAKEKKETLATWLGRSPASKESKSRVIPLLELLSKNEIGAFEHEFFNFFRKILAELRAQSSAPKEADALFMLLFLFIAEHNLDDLLSKDVQGLLHEGILFHDFGTQFGPNLEWVEQILQRRETEMAENPLAHLGHEIRVIIKAKVRCETCNKELKEKEIPGGFQFTAPSVKK